MANDYPNKTMRISPKLLLLVATLLTSCLRPTYALARPGLHFTDVTKSVGLANPPKKKTYSAAAGDFNLDGFPDLLVSHHGSITLWQNNSGKTFSLVTHIINDLIPRADTHGVSFIDINNDGYLDLAVSVGARRGRGKGANQYYLNNHGKSFSLLENPDSEMAYSAGRGRSIIPTDYNNDGQLDLLLFNYNVTNGERHRLVLGNAQGKSIISKFKTTPLPEGFNSSFAFECKIVPLDNTGNNYFILSGPGWDSGKIFKQSGMTLTEVTSELGIRNTGFISAVPFDFDNDGDLDLFYGKGEPALPNMLDVTDSKIMFLIHAYNQSIIRGFKVLATDGTIEINTRFEGRKHSGNLYLGKNKVKLKDTVWDGEVNTPILLGDPRINKEYDRGGFLWYDSKGYLNYSFIGSKNLQDTSGYIKAGSSNFSQLERLNLPDNPVPSSATHNSLYRNDNGHFTDIYSSSNVAGKGQTVLAISADFDNNGFIDIYSVNHGNHFGRMNPANQLFMNYGKGVFREEAETTGSTGINGGIGSGAIAFDFDNDGDIDIFTFNGNTTFPADPGRFSLLRNDSANHHNSIQLQLKGLDGNLKGWGTRILATTETNGTQMQLKYAGNGFLSTSDLPIHIGLGSNNDLKLLQIDWPSGNTEFMHNIHYGSKIELNQQQP